jgi:hypothetical protein
VWPEDAAAAPAVHAAAAPIPAPRAREPRPGQLWRGGRLVPRRGLHQALPGAGGDADRLNLGVRTSHAAGGPRGGRGGLTVGVVWGGEGLVGGCGGGVRSLVTLTPPTAARPLYGPTTRCRPPTRAHPAARAAPLAPAAPLCPPPGTRPPPRRAAILARLLARAVDPKKAGLKQHVQSFGNQEDPPLSGPLKARCGRWSMSAGSPPTPGRPAPDDSGRANPRVARPPGANPRPLRSQAPREGDAPTKGSRSVAPSRRTPEGGHPTRLTTRTRAPLMHMRT